MTYLRIFEIVPRGAAHVRIYVEHRNYPAFEYAVMLQVEMTADRWQTIHLFDNTHGVNERHMYTGFEKQPAESFLEDRPPNEVMPQAIGYLEDHWLEVLNAWRS